MEVITKGKMSNECGRMITSAVKEIFNSNSLLRNKVIIITNVDGKAAPIEDGNIYINLYSSSTGKKINAPIPMSVWNTQIKGTRIVEKRVFSPSKAAIPMCFAKDSWNSAEMIGNNFYLFLDICNYDKYDRNPILYLFFNQIADIYAGSSTEYRKIAAQNYLMIAKKLQQPVGYEKLLKSLDEDLKKAQSVVAEILIKRQNLVESVITSKKSLNKDILEIELERLQESPKIEAVLINDRQINVFTKTLYCTDPRTNKVHDIGKFRISVELRNNAINWFNLTRRVATGGVSIMQAPHVFSEGRACLGTAEKPLSTLLKGREYITAILLAIQFVESVNVSDSAGNHISEWPVKTGRVR